MLPWWARRAQPAAITQVLQALRDDAVLAILQPQGQDHSLQQHLARRRADDALVALVTTRQRSAAEPKAVQVPL